MGDNFTVQVSELVLRSLLLPATIHLYRFVQRTGLSVVNAIHRRPFYTPCIHRSLGRQTKRADPLLVDYDFMPGDHNAVDSVWLLAERVNLALHDVVSVMFPIKKPWWKPW